MRALVIGGTNFLGPPLVRRLVALGHEVAGFHRGLTGAELPSADPDRRSFQLDLIPSNLLDNVVTSKTFTPDRPGNFSGGAVDVTTKDYPDGRTLTVAASGGWLDDGTLRVEVIFLESPHRMDVVCSLPAGTAEATWRAAPLDGGRLQTLHRPR